MLRKLIKYEFKDTYFPMVLMFAALAVLTVFVCISTNGAFNIDGNLGTLVNLIRVILYIAFFMLCTWLSVIVFIIGCRNFKLTVFGDRGYLTHTLPAKTSSILVSKVIVAVVWIILSVLLVFIGSVSVVLTASDIGIPELAQIFKQLNFKELTDTITYYTGINPYVALLFLFLIIVLSLVSLFLFVTASMSIGQLANNHRTGFSILAGIGFIIIEKFISKIFLTSFGETITNLVNSQSFKDLCSYLAHNLFVPAMIETVLLIAVYYTVTWFITKKHLNLG